MWPPDYVISDHGSLTTSFRLVPVATTPPQDAVEDAAVTAKNDDCAASLVGVSAGKFSRSLEGDTPGADGDLVESRDWGVRDDGHYGLR